MAPPQTPRKKAKQPTQSEYKAIAAQFAAAKRAKQINDGTLAGASSAASTKAASAVEQRRVARDAARKATYELRWLWSVAFWMWLLAIHFAGVLYFTSGFLLTRLVLDEHSTCDASPAETIQSSDPSSCWHPKTFDRAVVVLIDALRYDFTVPVSDDAEFHNAFPFLYETAVSQPQNAFLRPFIADPPTTTLQRLKGLTTGTLPTFIDMGSNFAGTAIEEDNLLGQLRSVNKKIVHLGDDTWTALFPGYFEANISHAYDSFNVWDLHTVDNGVLDHIFPLIEEDKKANKKAVAGRQWDVLIGHCLGVDHAGHRYGPSHPAMTEKLQQMDDFVRRLVDTIDDDTLLVVMGDHGMDSKGDHGGESDDEIEAALWMYSKRPQFGRTSPAFVTPPATAKERPVQQIDLVPTLSLLLGIPIPYNNLGWPIEEAFVGSSNDDWANLATVGEIAAAGINRYQASYFAARGIETSSHHHPVLPAPAVTSLNSQRLSKAARKQAMADAYAALAQFQADNLRVCKDLWARFDVPSMVLGIVIMALGVVTLLLYASRSRYNEDDDIALVEDPTLDHAELMLELQGELAEPTTTSESNGTVATRADAGKEKDEDDKSLKRLQHLHRSLVVSGVAAGTPAFALGVAWSLLTSGGDKGSDGQPWFVVGAGAAAVFSTLSVSASLLGVSGGRRLLQLVPNTVWGWMAVIFTVAQSLGFASNSFTIWEDRILLHFLTTFGVVAALAAVRLNNPADRALAIYHAILFMVLGWVASYSRLCREEQMPFCKSTYYASANSSTSAPWQLLIPFVVSWLLPVFVRAYYEPTLSYEGLAPVWIGWVMRGGLFMAAVYWTLDAADNGGWWTEEQLASVGLPPHALKTASVYLAQMVLGLALVAGTVAFVWAGPCVRVTASAAGGRASRAQVAVLGYANAHGARYLLLPVNLVIALVQLSKPMGAGAMALMLWQIMSLIELLDLLKGGDRSQEEVDGGESSGTETGTQGQARGLSVIGPVVLAMLANFHYFTTGHQAALSSIQWDSAFIPLFTIRYPWSPLVVVANTFPGHILAAASVPLLVLWKTGPRRRGGLLTPTSRALAVFVAYFAVEALATMTWAAHLRRHLMLYRVFNPRFMLAAALLLLVDVAGIVMALMGLRANTLAVSEVFGYVDDY